MRGALFRGGLVLHVPGIIPADAGSTLDPGVMFVVGKDHPRGCGEHADHVAVYIGGGGSSPRMRGALKCP